ncbi:methylmalonyl-CoA mutase subunit beta [Psychroflexus sp. ALD_RP9]|uniref:methylmalonyl-CoA mutase subunit beta n=1 Tax=Psychroflexus sp. ALD_RP9 TaxID=2777186 RepID=UPI001A903BB8|nr:methylmalonyl-CoA mutase subunit beta [Psychroflexus sp. ALD_RP9]QSS96715.1 methylmalonyl-CoA mutase subunit beta [Psychroflexus sp. ALD_RP9]
MAEKLFKDFEPITSKAWKQKIQADLKGADYNEKLIDHSDEGFDVKPFYHQDTHQNIDLPITEGWRITEKIYLENYTAVTKIVNDVTNRGAESLWLIVPEANTKLFDLLKEIDNLQVPVMLEFLKLEQEFLKHLDEFSAELNIDILLNFDPIKQLSSQGDWQKSETEDLAIIQQFAQLKHLKPQLSIDARLFQNAGALKYQELSFSLAVLSEYFNYLNHNQALPKTIQLNLITSTGSNYFFEIAKLKSYRLLINSLANSFSVDVTLKIIAEPSQRNKTIYDYNVNMLRTTTECMSAVLGGADWVNNLAYDEIFHKTNEFGERISRNQLLILKHESYFDQVYNPTNGSYYIEELTQQLAQKALDEFKNIEKNDGYLSELFKGNITKSIEASAKNEEEKLQKTAFVMVGTNKYENADDRMKADLELYPFVKKQQRQVKFKPIIARRLAEKIELKRLDKEANA